MDRRTFLRGSALAVGGGALATVLASCSSSGGRSGPSSSHASAADDMANAGVSHGTPKRGGNLRIGGWSEESGLNPLYDAWDANGLLYGSTLFDTLALVTPGRKVVPNLATAIDHSSDYTEWTVTLRDGVTFHDGTPLDAAILVGNWEALRKAPLTALPLANLAGVKATGTNTVVFTMHGPWVPFDIYLTTPAVLHPKMFDPAYKGAPSGTGPFVYSDWVPGSQLIVTRNPNYWRKGLPYLDKVTFMPITNSQQRENAIQSDTVDIITVGSTIDNIPNLREQAGLIYRDGTEDIGFEPTMTYWILNCAKPPTDDIRIRRALAYATDQEKYSKLSFYGLSSATGHDPFVPVTGPFAPGAPWFTPTGYPTKPDMAKAQKLVKEYAAEHGTPTITVNAITTSSELVALQLAQSDWQQAGFKVEVEQLEVARLITNALKGDFQATYWSYGGATDPDQNYPVWNPASSQPIGTISTKPDRLQDSRIQPLLDKGRQSSDPATRVAAYQELSKVFADDLPYIYMGRTIGGYFARPNVKNWAGPTAPDGTPVLWSTAVATQSWLA